MRTPTYTEQMGKVITDEEISYLNEQNGMLRDYLKKCRLALIEVQGYLPTTYLGLVAELDESGLLK